MPSKARHALHTIHTNPHSSTLSYTYLFIKNTTPTHISRYTNAKQTLRVATTLNKAQENPFIYDVWLGKFSAAPAKKERNI